MVLASNTRIVCLCDVPDLVRHAFYVLGLSVLVAHDDNIPGCGRLLFYAVSRGLPYVLVILCGLLILVVSSIMLVV